MLIDFWWNIFICVIRIKFLTEPYWRQIIILILLFLQVNLIDKQRKVKKRKKRKEKLFSSRFFMCSSFLIFIYPRFSPFKVASERLKHTKVLIWWIYWWGDDLLLGLRFSTFPSIIWSCFMDSGWLVICSKHLQIAWFTQLEFRLVYGQITRKIMLSWCLFSKTSIL